MDGEFVHLWSFEIRPESRADFLAQYGSGGAWARLFHSAAGHLGTSLWEDLDRPGHYLTVDRWTSEGAYRDFLVRYAAEYEELDRRFEGLTSREHPLGRYRAL